MDTGMINGLFIGIAGPSGVGKGLIISKLKQDFPQFVYPISHTTRAMREGEKNGEVYNFISVEQFKKEIAAENFLEWAVVHQRDYYGTSKKIIMDALSQGRIVVREIDMQGIISIKKLLPRQNLVTIFIKPENLDVLKLRINRRGKLPEEEIARRLKSAEDEIGQRDLCDYEVFSIENNVEACYDEVKQIIMKEAQKAHLNL